MPLLTGFKGGQAVDPYDSVLRQTFQKAHNLDVFVDSNTLKPLNLKLQSMALPALGGQTNERVFNSYQASNGKYYFIGDATISSSLNLAIWSVDQLGASPTWTTRFNVATANPWTLLEEYKSGLFFGYGTTLARLDLVAHTSSTIGSVTNGITHLLNHRGLGFLFFVHNSGKTIGRYDNSTFSPSRLQLDADDECIGLGELGRWVVVGVRGRGSKSDRFLLWDGANTTVDDIYNTNSHGLRRFHIVGGIIQYIATTSNGEHDFINFVELPPGKSPRIVRSDSVILSSGTNTVNVNAIDAYEDTLFYGLDGEVYDDYPLGIFAYGTPDQTIPKFWCLHRLVSTGVTSGVSISSIKHNGTSLVITWGTSSGGVGTQHIDILTGDGITAAYADGGLYETNIFPLNETMPGEKGKIKRIVINHELLPANTGFTVSVRHFGNYPWGTSVPSQEGFQTLETGEGSGTVTGATQSTENAAMTEIDGHSLFKDARYAQLRILFDRVSNTEAPGIVFPIRVETT